MRCWPGRAVSVLTLTALFGCASALAATQAAVAAGAAALTPNPSSLTNHLYGISAPSASDTWAVGDYLNNGTGFFDTLAERWNGKAWTQFGSPDASSHDNHLLGVSATSAANPWAVGYYDKAATDTLAERWNGKIWTLFKSPDPSSQDNYLYGVSATSASNAWAAGYYCTNTACTTNGTTLILHWNGPAWKQVPSPNPTSASVLNAVSATSPSNAWAVGSYTKVSVDTLAEHWNGKRWSKT